MKIADTGLKGDRRLVAKVIDGRGEIHAKALFIEDLVLDIDQHAAAGAIPVGAIVELQIDERSRVERVEVLASPGSARARVYRILEHHAVDPIFPAAVIEEVASVLDSPGLDDQVIDCTAMPFVTIDNVDSRDLDQALFIERADEGGYVLHYALADASYYVRPESALFAEAMRRGTSYYLPGLCVPMLPEALSEGLVSLNPQVDRRALIMRIALDRDGAPKDTSFVRAKIHSRAKLSYPGVQTLYDSPEGNALAGQDYTESLLLLREVGELRIVAARRRGVVELNREELIVAFADDEGQRFLVEQRRRNDVERYNEQISLLCNTEGAALLAPTDDAPNDNDDARNEQPIFRTHPAPLAGRVDELDVMINAIVAAHELEPAVWRWRREDDEQSQAEDLASYLARLPDETTSRRVRLAIERQVRYVNRASQYRAESAPHHALAVESYARFSSPMREIVGIFTHKEALEKLGLQKSTDPQRDERLRDHAIETANRARTLQRRLERAANKVAIDQLFAGDLEAPVDARPWRPGSLLGLRGSRLYVELDAFPVDLKVYTFDIEARLGCRYRDSDDGILLLPHGKNSERAPRFVVGGQVFLRTLDYDPSRERWRIEPAVSIGD